MANDQSPERVTFLGKPVPATFEMRTLVIEPGDERPYDQEEWRGAIVVIEKGQLDLECTRGGSRRFVEGNVLWLFGLPLRRLHNPGPEPAVIASVARAD
jgi:hypothetical protein